ncbi:hypothetical protein JK2ML_0957 [Mycobacterium leprae Kyoto-2]|uniref:Uncharacterized protein n=4 Tax=Mycobacterium leprae TaxID=1769 RepID=Q9CCC7_MYCLE|nr:hypothetical protein DIJ64_05145 [Mycobacterium leprae]OAR20714.1 hypothetical protein A8144_09500 [Mycobacterium leprae 3125609]OAX70893.1 hypothetical protein A3216_09275 [Mycobacterium leprae 7935681]CAR71052.1 hypothetical protein MLBr00957 [Mycobacterium leprae Br4923]BBC16883.1 hypothetical protein JK2ML_0957 [Mycobacterium leprae Kyoto-2]
MLRMEVVRRFQTLSFSMRRRSGYPTRWGGVGSIYQCIATELGAALHVSQAVRHIEQDRNDVHGTHQCVDSADTPNHRGNSAGNRHPDRLRADAAGSSFLHQYAVFKISVCYDELIKRTDVLCGQ